MKNIGLIVLAVVGIATVEAKAQTADDVVNNYLIGIGGADKWASVKTLRMLGKIKMQSVEVPVTIVQGAGGRMKISTFMNGTEFVQMAFDGTIAWSTNAVTKIPEKMSEEDTYNLQQDAIADFPDPFLNYRNRGYEVQVEGTEKLENVDHVKVKLIKKPQKVNNVMVENSVYYYMNPINSVPFLSQITLQKGPIRGIMQEIMYRNYQNVEGILFPFEMNYRMNGQPGQTILIEKININPKLEDKEFAFPAIK
ncbi:hypothetical protein [Runella sp.]|uniref:hypothetical protein n=1 Tax=Runella sp. TaxID=1960881 RepID=UPI003D1341CA